VEEAARGAGANGAYLIEQPMAAAIGAGLPIHEPLGNMIVDVGGGTTEVAVISLGGIVALQAIRVGSFDVDASIQTYVRREYGIAIGERTAEEIKVAIGSAWPMHDEVKAEVRGRDLMTGLPKTVILSPEEVREATDEQVGAIVDSVVRCLGMAPPELAQDLIGQGIHLVGGGGMLRGLDRRLAEETAIPVQLVDAPLECVVLGAGKCLEAFESLKVMFMGGGR
jgi:rod shape-determining protein MreB